MVYNVDRIGLVETNMQTIKSNSSIYHSGSKNDPFLYNKISRELTKAMNRIDRLEKEVQSLREENKKLKNENERLNRIINNNSGNSSLPPSSDQKPSKAPNEYNGRKKTNKHLGGQLHHRGTTLDPAKIESQIKAGIFKRKVIVSDELTIRERLMRKYVKRYVLDVKITPIVYEYHLPIRLTSTMAPVSYGSTIKSMAVTLNVEHAVSIDRTASFINVITGNTLSLSHGTIDNFISSFSNQATTTISNIEGQLLDSNIVYTDATNVSLNGVQSYIRNQSTSENVL